MSQQQKKANKRPWGPTCGSWLFDLPLTHVALAVTEKGNLGPLKGKPEHEDQRNPRATCTRETEEESSVAPHEYRIVPSHEFHLYNDKGNMSIRCWAAIYVGGPAESRPLQPRAGDELESTVWMDVATALVHPQLTAARRSSLAAAHACALTATNNVASLPLASEWMTQEGEPDKQATTIHKASEESGPAASASAPAPVAKAFKKAFKIASLDRPAVLSSASISEFHRTGIDEEEKKVAPMSNQERAQHTQISKGLSWLLRHHAHEFPTLQLRPDGYVRLDRVLSEPVFKQLPRLRGATVADVRRVVAACPKQRFQLEEDSKDGVLLIRCTQGHSQAASQHIDAEQLLRRLDSPPDHVVMHGTQSQLLSILRREGLSRMSREFIHMTDRLPGANDEVSGMRANCDLVVLVDVRRAMQESAAALAAAALDPTNIKAKAAAANQTIVFFQSTNGVLLTRGCGTSGRLPPRLLRFCSRAEASALVAGGTQ